MVFAIVFFVFKWDQLKTFYRKSRTRLTSENYFRELHNFSQKDNNEKYLVVWFYLVFKTFSPQDKEFWLFWQFFSNSWNGWLTKGVCALFAAGTKTKECLVAFSTQTVFHKITRKISPDKLNRKSEYQYVVLKHLN